jgi:hypothetical protein
MADLKEAEIEIANRETRRYTTLSALLSERVPCNIIERACLEELRRPWTRCESGIAYDFSDYASPPLGRCGFQWSWKGCSATASTVFIVVEKIEGTACRIILGPSASQKPVIPAANDALTFTTSKRTKGMLSSLFHSYHLADYSTTEEQDEHRERVRLAALQRANEKAQDEARIREGWEKKEREKRDTHRARLA